ncbi:cytochrome c oxidase subunit 3 [Sediminitomix flava]|uniref:Cytochrome c oxidase subunit 3 n=1 Tax=Sediminitomix flava TaxID=379075 RepID=A0A315ZAZ7_SEDFL|nr:cytochrome c oxidase subunit 3 [Sediminitomix flava]PWJ42530.1 cytochrome c oxidase subunit 3 [Sediminitomix flava]
MTTDNMTATTTSQGVHPKKFVLWLLIVSIVMLFAAFISAYIVRQAEGEWLVFDLPNILYASTAVIALSSLSMQWSVAQAKKNDAKKTALGVGVTFLLGALFLALQWMGWTDLVNIEVHFSFANPAGSFVYVLTGVHAFHLITGLIYLLIVFFQVRSVVKSNNVNAKRILNIEMCATYWHFLGGLWVLLYVFLLLKR